MHDDTDVYLIVMLYNERSFLTEHLEEREGKQHAVIQLQVHRKPNTNLTVITIELFLKH